MMTSFSHHRIAIKSRDSVVYVGHLVVYMCLNTDFSDM